MVEVERFRAAVEEHLGLAFDDAKLSLLLEILDHRVRSLGYRSAADYLDRHLGDPLRLDELDAIAERVTVGETYFFRNRDQFRVLTELAVPELLARRDGGRRLSVLSAGCASGEEAYSVAISLCESLPDLEGRAVSIRAFDVNPAVLQAAAAGRYSSWSLRETPADLRDRYFLPEGPRKYRLDRRIQRMVEFERRNLCQEDAGFFRPGRFDVIFCRNVLMYFSPRAAREAVARLERSLAPGGYLFLGTAETLRGLSEGFCLKHECQAFYYQRREQRAVPPDAGARPRPAQDRPPPTSEPGDSWMVTIQRAAGRIDDLARGLAPAPTPTMALSPQGGGKGGGELMREERFPEARELIGALPAEAADVDALLLRAILLTNHGRPHQAEALCEEVLRRDELNAGAHYLLALCREHAGDREAAADHDQYARYLDPAFAMPRLHLGLMARRAGDFELARRELEQALLLLAREDASRIVLLGGGFTREGLVALCRAELDACGGAA